MNQFSAVIVTFNNERTVKKCLESVIKFEPEAEIIVIDNSSSDLTVKIVQSFKGRVILIESDKNLGFARANNIGVQKASKESVIILNPDTEILNSGALQQLVDVLFENPEFGIIGPKLIHADGNIQKSVRNLPNSYRAFKEYFLGIKNEYDFYIPETQILCEVESIVGACIAIKKELFERVRGFDEKYFLYFEDLDLCKKVRKMGFKIGYNPSVEVKHYEGVSGLNQKTFSLLQESAKKYHGLLAYSLIQLIIRLGGLIR